MIDTHVHLFVRGLPLAPVRRYVPDYDATVETYRALMKANGITRAVIVQPSFLGTDNSFMCDITRRFPDVFRGIATVDVNVSDDELDALAKDGIVGIRLNLDGLPLPDFASSKWQRLFDALKKRRWQIEVHRQARDLPVLIDPLLETGIDIVVDHFGRPDDDLGVEDLGFKYLVRRGDSPNLWVKLSASYRNGDAGRGSATAVKAARILIDRMGTGRLMWGSDWPHTRHESTEGVGKAVRELETWVPNATERHHILDSSAGLFHFD